MMMVRGPSSSERVRSRQVNRGRMARRYQMHAQIDRLRDRPLQSTQKDPGPQLPLYEFQCRKCGHRFERIQKFSDPDPKKCPECGGRMERMLAAPAVQFKGSGFYQTDYARKGSAPPSEGKSESKSEEKSETKPKAESKPEHKKDKKK